MRNAFNNGFVVLEGPRLYDELCDRLGGRGGETIVGPTITIDFASSRVVVDGSSFEFSPMSTVAQELIVAGGAENLVRSRLG